MTVVLSALFVWSAESGIDPQKQKTIFDFKKQSSPQSPLIIDRKKMDVNRISAWFRNDGEFFSDHSTTGPGFEWPKGSGIHAIFSAGLWLGAKVQTDTGKEIRVATAGHFGSEYRPGTIINGQPDDYTKLEYRYYKVRPLKDHPDSNPDYAEWPVQQGAPFYDANGDGVYNPAIDKPALMWGGKASFPDMLMYTVYNDADSSAHNWIWGKSKPLGVEVRQTNWAFDKGGLLSDVVFSRFEIINKSNQTWDSLYFTLWSDPDLGDPSDDYVGVDTSYHWSGKANMAYCYNGDEMDGPSSGYGLAPPAVGYKLLQGPVVYTGIEYDTARWSGEKIPSSINLNLSSFNFICKSTEYCDPAWWFPSLHKETYNLMQGLLRNGSTMRDPNGKKTKFAFAGDPVSGEGWINSQMTSPTDVYFAMSTGPVTMSPGDTQQIVLATIIGRGSSNLQSTGVLRGNAFLTQILFDLNMLHIPMLDIKTNYLSPTSTEVIVRVDEPFADSIRAEVIKDYSNVITTFQLFDDGLHDDENANDGIWGNKIYLTPDPSVHHLMLDVSYKDGNRFKWPYNASITTFGPVELKSFSVAADNINQDNKANPGENVHYEIGIQNKSPFSVSNLSVHFPVISDQYIFSPGGVIEVNDTLLPNASSYPPYDINTKSYVVFDISPSIPSGYILPIVVYIHSGYYNMWIDTVYLRVDDYTFPPRLEYPQHTSGQAEGSFGIRLVDSSTIRNNEYHIRITKNPFGETIFNLLNITRGDTLLKEHELPNLSGHNIPVTDGFRLTRGNITTAKGISSATYIPASNKWFKGTIPSQNADVKDLGIFYPRLSNFIAKNSAIDIENLRTIEIRFSTTLTQKAYRYLAGFFVRPPVGIIDSSFVPYVLNRNGAGFLYQDYEKFPLGNPDLGRTVPFTVWERNHKTGADRQLNIAIVERNDTLYRSTSEYVGKGKIDGKWFPTTHPVGGSEFLYIFSSTYSEIADTFYTKRNLSDYHEQFDIYYTLAPRLVDSNSTFTDGDTLRIVPYFPLKVDDVFSFNPMKLLDVNDPVTIPQTYELYQNYPNPFNPNTAIKYRLSEVGRVTLKVYNLLGQEVKTLVDEIEEPGFKTIQWNATNNAGQPVASGVYFFRLIVNSANSQSPVSYIQTKKMVLIR